MHLPTFTAVRVSPSPTALRIAVCIVAYTTFGVAARSLQQSSACTSGVDVTEYGADASGQADSSQAFNEAIVAASTERLFVCVPPGTYKAFADIDVNVDGLLVLAPSGASIVFGASNVQFFVRGNGNTVQNLNINCDNSAASGFVITGGGNVVTGCSAINCGAHGFVIDGQSSACGGNTVSGCTASSNMMVGIAQNDCSGNAITSNTASSNQFEGITADNQANGAQILGNTLTGNAIAGGVGSIGVDHSNGVVISNNQISNSMDGMPGIETKNNLGPSIGLSITGNTITGSAGVAIWLLCNNGCTYGSTISGNTLSGNAGTGNFCNGMIQEDDLGGNNIINC